MEAAGRANRYDSCRHAVCRDDEARRKTRARDAASERDRDRQRQARRQLGEPTLLVYDQRRGERAAWQPYHEIVAEPCQDVVPSVRDDVERLMFAMDIVALPSRAEACRMSRTGRPSISD